MNLHTLCYLPEAPIEQVDPTIGLRDLRKGLCTIMLGYVLCAASILAAGGVLWYVVVQIQESGASRKVLENASTILFATALLFFLGLIGSLILVVRGKWICLMHAPESYNAKWHMFAAILCILSGPALNRASILLPDSDAPVTAAKSEKASAADITRTYENYKPAMPQLNTRGYVKLAGQGIGLLSSIFFAASPCAGATKDLLSQRSFFSCCNACLWRLSPHLFIDHRSFLRDRQS
jgi:hypothetical protein